MDANREMFFKTIIKKLGTSINSKIPKIVGISCYISYIYI
jgi:hypothetical protein